MTRPAGLRRHPQTRVLQVDAESSLGTIGGAVAVAGFAVADFLVIFGTAGEREIVACIQKKKKSKIGTGMARAKKLAAVMCSL